MIANLVPLFRLLRDMNLLNTLTALILVGAAQGQIFAIFMLRNFVADIPQDLYEAAEIDGASHFRQMWHDRAAAFRPHPGHGRRHALHDGLERVRAAADRHARPRAAAGHGAAASAWPASTSSSGGR